MIFCHTVFACTPKNLYYRKKISFKQRLLTRLISYTNGGGGQSRFSTLLLQFPTDQGQKTTIAIDDHLFTSGFRIVAIFPLLSSPSRIKHRKSAFKAGFLIKRVPPISSPFLPLHTPQKLIPVFGNSKTSKPYRKVLVIYVIPPSNGNNRG